MMRKMFVWAGLGGILLLPVLTSRTSAALPDTLRLSLAECERLALDRGEEMKLAAADLQTAQALYQQARATAMPQLHFSTTYTRQIESVFRSSAGGDFSAFDPDTLAPLEDRVRDLEKALPTSGLAGLAGLFSNTSFGSENSWVANLSLSQKLIEGGSIWNSIAAAKHAMRAADLIQADRAAETALQVREAYLQALLADRSVAIAQLALEQAESQLQRVRLRHDAGSASEFELLQAEVQRDNQIPTVMRARAGREVAYLELARLTNVPGDRAIRLETPILDDAAVPAEPAAVDTAGLVDLALRAAGVDALEEALQARENAVGVAASGKWPSLSLFADYSRQAYPDDPFPKSGQWQKDIRAGLVLNWSLFDGFRTRGAIQESKAKRSQAEQTLHQTRELIREAVRQSEWDMGRAAAELHARSRTVQLARRAHELATLRYEEGASDLLEVSDSRIAYQIAQLTEAEARRDYFSSLARLERYSGRPLFTALVPARDESR